MAALGDRLLAPVHRWVWADPRRRANKLIAFARTEADGGRDLARAAETTPDGVLRRLYLRHARDEAGHAALFTARAQQILAELPAGVGSTRDFDWLSPGERGVDRLSGELVDDATLLAFLHLSERAAARRFAVYQEVISDEATAAVFARVLRDEEFHMTYTRRELTRVAPRRHGWQLWRGRLGRLWKVYLRLATALAGVLGGIMLLVQYFVLLPVFALAAKWTARRELGGWRTPERRPADRALRSQF